MVRGTVATINLSHFRDNYELLRNESGLEVFGVVKANAYGHGALRMAQELQTLKTPFLCVSSMDEAISLYQAGIRHDILIFSYVDPSAIEKYHQEYFVYTMGSLEWLSALNEVSFPVRIHIELNTGMNRFGLKSVEDLRHIKNTHHVLEGVYTHFPSPSDMKEAHKHLATFYEMLDFLDHDFKWVHLGNAPLRIAHGCKRINAIRVGLGLYGYRIDVHDLKPVLSLQTQVVHIDDLKKGETLGYDYSYKASEDCKFATIPIGYGDGFDMRNSASKLWINHDFYPVIGKVCMDQTMVLVDGHVACGDKVEIIGSHRLCPLIQSQTGISIYVILTSIASRVERVYI